MFNSRSFKDFLVVKLQNVSLDLNILDVKLRKQYFKSKQQDRQLRSRSHTITTHQFSHQCRNDLRFFLVSFVKKVN